MLLPCLFANPRQQRRQLRRQLLAGLRDCCRSRLEAQAHEHGPVVAQSFQILRERLLGRNDEEIASTIGPRQIGREENMVDERFRAL